MNDDFIREDLNCGRTMVTTPTWRAFLSFMDSDIGKDTTALWRGHRQASWLLEPTLQRTLRRMNIIDQASVAHAADAHLMRFMFSMRGRGGPRHETHPDEWWPIGRHHGLATPLLDWTSSPFVALFFAFEEAAHADDTDDMRALWAIRRAPVNRIEEKVRLVPSAPGVAPPILVWINPTFGSNARLISQSGVLSKNLSGVDVETWVRQHVDKDESERVLIKVLLPTKIRAEVLRALNRMNINHATLFPDPDGSARFCNHHLEIPDY